MVNIDKELFQRINVKLGHFLMLNEIATSQRKKARSLSNKEAKAMEKDRLELTALIKEVSDILNDN